MIGLMFANVRFTFGCGMDDDLGSLLEKKRPDRPPIKKIEEMQAVSDSILGQTDDRPIRRRIEGPSNCPTQKARCSGKKNFLHGFVSLVHTKR